MTFERGAWGQANRAIFYGVDWIIYTEGGGDEQETTRSFDAIFWSGVFRALGDGRKFKAVPRGGKDQLLPIADELINEGIDNIIVAMDRDYDGFFGKMIDHPQIIYTHGYSFENDIYSKDSILEIFGALFPDDFNQQEVGSKISDWTKRFEKEVRWPLKCDLFAYRNGVAGFDREKPQKYMQSNAYGAEPLISADRLRAEKERIVAACHDKSLGGVSLPTITCREVIGHFYEVFIFRLITSLQTSYSKSPKIKYESLRTHAITHFQVRVLRQDNDDEVARYYASEVESALAA